MQKRSRLQFVEYLQRAEFLPGVFLAVLLAITARYLSILIGVEGLGFTKSPVSPILVSIILGLGIRNLVGLPDWFTSGLHFSQEHILKAGVMLMGLQVSLGAISKIGVEALPIVAGCIVAAMIITNFLSRLLGLSKHLGTLIAVGTSICGCTAIIATAPVIRARQPEVCYAVACVALFGTVGMLAYPFLAHALFGDQPLAAGVFLGTAIHDTAQVVGAGMLYEQYFQSPAGLESATITKLVRNLSMIIVIPAMAWRFARHQAEQPEVRAQLRSFVPLFIFGFVAMSLLRTVGDLYGEASGILPAAEWQALIALGKQAAEILLTVAMAAVGLSTSLAGIREIGLRPFAVGLTAAVLVGLVSLAMIRLFIY